MLLLIYPDKRLITEEEVISWALDRRADVVLKEHAVSADVDVDTYRTPEGFTMIFGVGGPRVDMPIPTLEEAKAELEDAGVATFGRN